MHSEQTACSEALEKKIFTKNEAGWQKEFIVHLEKRNESYQLELDHIELELCFMEIRHSIAFSNVLNVPGSTKVMNKNSFEIRRKRIAFEFIFFFIEKQQFQII